MRLYECMKIGECGYMRAYVGKCVCECVGGSQSMGVHVSKHVIVHESVECVLAHVPVHMCLNVCECELQQCA